MRSRTTSCSSVLVFTWFVWMDVLPNANHFMCYLFWYWVPQKERMNSAARLRMIETADLKLMLLCGNFVAYISGGGEGSSFSQWKGPKLSLAIPKSLLDGRGRVVVKRVVALRDLLRV